MKFRKKPVVINAFQFTRSPEEVFDWADTMVADPPAMYETSEGKIAIDTLEGTITADRMDWIICGVKGEFYPVKPDIFTQTYEPTDDATR